ncbi:MAG: hypothetical protein HQL25_02055 [Candidatus Omnitrophica bacterium]|nr:hypothetical protein [Candidatus Omnitrophota bacterium]
MTLFYDPLKRKPKIWAVCAFAIVPVILILLLFLSTKGAVEKQKAEQVTEEKDIFQK